jgi:hypothetical protein
MGYGKIKVKMDKKEKQEKIVNISKYVGNFKPSRKDITNHQYAKTLVNMFEDLMYEVGEKDDGSEDINHYADSQEWKVDTIYVLGGGSMSPKTLVEKYLDDPVATKKGEFSRTSRANIVGSLIEYLLVVENEEKKDIENLLVISQAIKYFRSLKESLFDGIKQDYQKNAFTKEQQLNYISFKELHNDFYNKIKKRVKNIDEGSWERIELLNVRLLLKLLMEHPSRNEYATLFFIRQQEFRKIKEPTKNYIVIRSNKNPLLSIGKYKTEKIYGRKENVITNKELKHYIMEIYKFTPPEHNEYPVFILPKTQEQWNNHNVSQILNKWSDFYLGKNISSTMIYKIVINDLGLKYKKLIDEGKETDEETKKIKKKLTEYAQTRGHSNATQLNIYIKGSTSD